MVALSMAAMELMVLAGCSCAFVWAFQPAVELDFLQFKPLSISKDTSGCVASAHNMHLLGRSKQVVPPSRVCVIQKLIRDGIISAQQCPIAVQIPDIGTKALPRVPVELEIIIDLPFGFPINNIISLPFEFFTIDRTDRHVGSK